MNINHSKGVPLRSPYWSLLLPFAILLMLALAACGGSSAPQAQKKPAVPPTPTPSQGQQMLGKVGYELATAKTLHAIYDLTIHGQLFNGTVNSEVWNEAPNKNRTVVRQSTLSQFPTGSITVTDGKQVWQYDPTKKVVYTGSVSNTNTNTSAGAGTPTASSNVAGGSSRLILSLVQTVFTRSNAVLVSSSANVQGHDAYDVHVTPLGQPATAGTPSGGQVPRSFNYDGDVFIDKATMLPVQVNLTIQGFGQVLLNLPMLALNGPVDESLFTFVPPPGVKVLPLPKQMSDTGAISLTQAEQQAGYHLLSIPAPQSGYQLQGVDALGAPGNQIYSLNYAMGNTTFTISEGKPLANLPSSGQQVHLRGTTATLSSSNGFNTLSWTENGVGIQIAGKLSDGQLEAIANVLS